MSTILLSYASEHGATAEIANTIGNLLRYRGLHVHIKRAESVESLANYDVVIIGSAVYLGQWLPPAVDFLNKFADDLSLIPVWVFTSGPTGDGQPLKSADVSALPENIQTLMASIKPREIAIFRGKVDLRRLNKTEQRLFKTVGGTKGDFRDWDAIKAWANGLADALLVRAIVEKSPTDLLSLES